MLSCGIVGLPNVGKSTLFNALLKKQQALAANYPFATIEPNVGVVPVPDERLEKLRNLVIEENKGSNPEIIPATVRFVDIAGLVKGASQGEGLGNQFLSHIREVDAIVQVVRNFSDENVIRSGSTEPKSDMEVVNMELVLADLQTLEKRLSTGGKRALLDKKEAEKAELLSKIKNWLDSGKLVSQMGLSEEEKILIKDLNLLTTKPFIYVLNSDEDKVGELSSSDRHPEGRTNPKDLNSRPARIATQSVAGGDSSGRTPQNDVLYVSAKLEAELSALSIDEQKDYLSQLNIKESGLDKVIKKAYEILGLITFLTAGPKEVRAWTTKKESKAPQAAGVIHTDFERGFIAAEVISTKDLLSARSFKVAKDLGKIRLEGKEYVMNDGDVVEFRFSV